MSKALPAIGDTVYVNFGSELKDFAPCEVVEHIDRGTIRVEHQVFDGLETTEITFWIDTITYHRAILNQSIRV